MTLEIAFLMITLIYLVIIAYSVVGGRRRGAPGRVRAAMAALIVLIPPLGILFALYSTGDSFLFAGWGVVTLAMLACGAVTAALTEFIARRVGA